MRRDETIGHGSIQPSAEVMTWLRGFVDLGCVFIELVFKADHATGKVAKKPRRKLHHYQRQTGEMGLVSALAWLGKGSPIGIIPKGGLWVLDADDAEQVERVVSLLFDQGITPLMVSTSRGAHFYFALPGDFPLDGLKNAVHVPALDFIFGPRTLVVAPGSKSKGREYPPAGPWFPPPVLDPRAILPDGEFWDEEDTRPFLVSTESLARRSWAARGYLDHQAPVCIRGTGKGSRTLAKVAAHVCGWYLMKPTRATAMMTGPGSWNARFLDGAGKLTPFSRDEILAACIAADRKGSEYGRRRWIEERASQELTRKMEGHIEILMTCLTEPKNIRVPVAEVLGVFSWLGCPDLTATKFGLALGAHGINRVQATKRKLRSIEKLNIWTMTNSLIEAERVRQGNRNVCPLVARVRPEPQSGTEGESLKEHQPITPSGTMSPPGEVERVVSSVACSETPANTRRSLEYRLGEGYQTCFEWAEKPVGLVLAPTSPYLAKLRVLVSTGLLPVMAPRHAVIANREFQ